ncbi:release factor [Wilcoxina mikolae CBS 423.85]|nr:release factor [Wilcoxina mikolae CBS 423.85]
MKQLLRQSLRLNTCQRFISRPPPLAFIPKRYFQASGSRSETLTPALLRRARTLSDEHAALNKKLQDNFDGKIARRVGELSTINNALKEYEEATNNMQELVAMLIDKSLDPELRALAEEDFTSTTTAITALTAKIQQALVPTHPFAHLPALLEIRPGTGGSEAAIFANDLWRMYTAYCTIRGWPVSVVSVQYTDGGDGLIEGIFEVTMDGAYGELRLEAGVHRVQRIPATETKGRVHTSTATVMVLPSFPSSELAEGEEDPDSIIDMKDVRVDIMRARGAGGQHVNTTDSAVRMTHIPTGTVAAIQDSRSQHKNREKCLQVLKSRIAQKRRDEREAEELAMRRGAAKVGAGRSDKMRTYNYSQNRVTDHRAGYSLHDLPGCMEGEGLEKLIEEVKKWKMSSDVEMLTEA